MLSKHLKSRGFTLIELLIVVAVIGILAGILITIINPKEMTGRSRDAIRVSDVNSITRALSNAIAAGAVTLVDTTGCVNCDSSSGTLKVDGTGWIPFTVTKNDGLGDFMPRLPQDPTNEGQYVYTYASNGNKFEVNAVLESSQFAEMSQNDGGDNDVVYERGLDLELIN